MSKPNKKKNDDIKLPRDLGTKLICILSELSQGQSINIGKKYKQPIDGSELAQLMVLFHE